MGSPSIPEPQPMHQQPEPPKKKPMVFKKDAENTKRKKLGVKRLTIPLGLGSSSSGTSGLGIPGSD